MHRALPILLALAWAPSASAQETDARASRLADLRAEVAELAEAIELEREDLRARLRALDAQKADVQVQLRRAELRLTELRKAADERKEDLAGEASAGEALKPVVKAGLDDLRKVVRAGLPFRVVERLEALDKLEAQVDEGVLSPRKAAHRTWQFYEDELRLTRENALDRQIIPFEGAESLVEVARVGMLAMYFRTEEGVVGHAVRNGDGWDWVPYTDPAAKEQVDTLFDALGKQIRSGWFELPDLVEGA